MPSPLRVVLAAMVLVVLGTESRVLGQTLVGESFLTQEVQRLGSSCDFFGNSWFAYLASGTAEGPYAGPFVEVGVVVVGPPTFLPNPGGIPPFIIQPGPILAWNVVFAISAPAGQVFGIQSFNGNSNGGICLPFSIERDDAGAVLPYQAVISSTSGDILFDQGLARTGVTLDISVKQLSEVFTAP